MTAPRPDYSPQMLAFFLRARAADRRGREDCSREIAARLLNWAGVDPGERMTRWSGVL